MGESGEAPAVARSRRRRRGKAVGLLLFAAMIAVSGWAHLSGLSHEGIDDVDSAALYRMLTHRLPSHDLSFFGGYTEGVSMPAYLWGRYSYLLTLWIESCFIEPTVYFVYLQNALLGILVSVVLWRSGNRFVGRGVGVYAGTAFALGNLTLFYTRHMKDYAFTLLFLALGMHLLCAAWNRFRIRTFAFAGLALGASATANYSVLPAVATVLGVAAAVALLDACRGKAAKLTLLKHFVALAGGLLAVVLAVEAFAPIVAFYFPFWEIPPTWGYLKGLFAHQASAEPRVGSYLHSKGASFYIYLLWRQGFGLFVPALAGLALVFSRREYLTRYVALFVAVLVLPLSVYSLSGGVASLARNALPSYLGFAVLTAIGYHAGVRLAVHSAKRIRFSPTLARSLAQCAMLTVLIAAALPEGLASTVNRSGAEQVSRMIRTDRVCITAPDEFAYHWTWYYFPDPRMACRTWDDVVDRFLNDGAEYLVVLPERYHRWEKSSLAQWNGPSYCTYLDRFDYAASGPVRAYDLHEPTLQQQLGLGKATVLIRPTDLEAPSCVRSDASRALQAAEGARVVSVPAEGTVEIRGSAYDLEPNDLLLLAVGTPEAPLRYCFKVFPARVPDRYLGVQTPPNVIQTCIGVQGPTELRIALACLRAGMPESRSLPVNRFSVTHYAGPRRPALQIEADTDNRAANEEMLARFEAVYPEEIFANSRAWTRWGAENSEHVTYNEGGLTLENLGHTVLQPAGALWTFEPGEYRPGAVYRVTFRGQANRMQEGEVDLVVGRVETSARIVRKRLGFWKPWWDTYSFDFMAPPDGTLPFSLLFREARAPRRFGKVEVRDISVRECTNASTTMRAPDDEIDFP